MTVDPVRAWQRLAEGNERFVAGKPQHPHQDSSHRSRLVAAQQPFATLFGCSDSRVAAELIFDVGLGDLFVVRTAGQVADATTLGTLEYGIDVVRTPLLVVLGHDRCGAVTAAREAYTSGHVPGGFIADVVSRLTPAVIRGFHEGRTEVDDLVEVSVQETVRSLPERSPAIRTAIDENRLAIVGVTYRLEDGVARLVTEIDSPPTT